MTEYPTKFCSDAESFVSIEAVEACITSRLRKREMPELKSEIKANWKTYECPNCGDVCDIDINDAVDAWHHRWKSVTCSECVRTDGAD
jgi:hypothetical protein